MKLRALFTDHGPVLILGGAALYSLGMTAAGLDRVELLPLDTPLLGGFISVAIAGLLQAVIFLGYLVAIDYTPWHVLRRSASWIPALIALVLFPIPVLISGLFSSVAISDVAFGDIWYSDVQIRRSLQSNAERITLLDRDITDRHSLRMAALRAEMRAHETGDDRTGVAARGSRYWLDRDRFDSLSARYDPLLSVATVLPLPSSVYTDDYDTQRLRREVDAAYGRLGDKVIAFEAFAKEVDLPVPGLRDRFDSIRLTAALHESPDHVDVEKVLLVISKIRAAITRLLSEGWDSTSGETLLAVLVAFSPDIVSVLTLCLAVLYRHSKTDELRLRQLEQQITAEERNSDLNLRREKARWRARWRAKQNEEFYADQPENGQKEEGDAQ